MAQRVKAARVEVEGQVVAEIGPGLVAFVGIARGDGAEEVGSLGRRLGELRIFPDEQGRMNRSVAEVGGAVLLVPNFTVMGDCSKGRRPSFDKAAPPQDAERLFDMLVEAVGQAGVRVARGRFGALMRVTVENEGPVTVVLETRREGEK